MNEHLERSKGFDVDIPRFCSRVQVIDRIGRIAELSVRQSLNGNLSMAVVQSRHGGGRVVVVKIVNNFRALKPCLGLCITHKQSQ